MNRRVLLVDDQADALVAVRQLLVSRYEVSLASSGQEALAQCEQNGPFAVVLSDYGMPGMNGVELFSALSRRWPDTARILLTGCADLGLAMEALERGAIYRFMTKPPNPGRLLDAIAAGVARFRAIEEERVLTEQLSFARESLQALNGVLEQRLERELQRLEALAQGSENIAAAESPEEVLERTSTALRNALGPRAQEISVSGDEGGLELVPHSPLRTSEQRTLAIIQSSARGALAGARRRAAQRETERATLLALQRTAQERDDDTGEHLARVSAFTRLLAEGLRDAGHYLDEIQTDFVEDLALTAPLHDIGKVAIPDSILLKPGKLSPEEWKVMQTHAAIGAQILHGVHAGSGGNALLEMASEIARTHHERWDGTGYPRAISATDIPLVGRIMALADCYDALTSVRPYKHAWPHAEAVAHIQQQRGKAFDPAIVDIFLAHQREFEDIRRSAHGEPAAGQA